MSPEDLARVVAFMCAAQDACAERIIEMGWGKVILDSRHPRLWDANQIRIDASTSPDVDELIHTATRYLRPPLARMIVALSETCGAALERPLRRAGYSESHQLLMVLDAPLGAEEWGTAISELSGELLTSSRMAAQLHLKDGDPRIASQLISRDRLLEALLSQRCLAVLAEDRVLARCQLYTLGQVAQIDHLYTDPAHRRRGFARALVTHAARMAKSAGAETVFLLTDLTGTPQNMYRQIGFSEAAVVHRFRVRHGR